MGSSSASEGPMREVRRDYYHQSRYLSKEFADLEKEHIFKRTWQWACRREEIPQVGDYVVYDIADQSVIVVRTSESEIKAFHNVCPHRGRRLLSGTGHITKFHCIFHAWQWDLEGKNTRVLDHGQWEGCPGMSTDDLKLAEVHVAQWGGFVFICMADEPESFEEFMAPAPDSIAPLKLDRARLCWHLVIDVDCNWKVAQEAFMESYHVWGTHPQLLPFIDENNFSRAQGKHGQHLYTSQTPPGVPSRRLNKSEMTDVDEIRKGFSGFIGALGDQLSNATGQGQLTKRSVDAGQKALAELPSGTEPMESMGAAMMAMKAAAEADDAYFPLLTEEQHAKLGEDWNIFPTLSIVPTFDGTLIFRALPRDDDPNKATIEMISLLHFGKGKEPKVERQFVTDWRTQHKDVIPPLLLQDLINMEDVQKGMHSIGLKAIRPNPVQEVQVSHFHEVINHYLFGDSYEA